MDKIEEVVIIERPETGTYLLYIPSTTSTDLTFTNNDDSADQSCLGQLMKNNVIIY
jgi:hypothetical protein